MRREVEDLRERLGAPLDLRGGHAVQPPEVGQRLAHGELGVQRHFLKKEGKILLGQVADVTLT